MPTGVRSLAADQGDRAVDDALKYNEFFAPNDVKIAAVVDHPDIAGDEEAVVAERLRGLLRHQTGEILCLAEILGEMEEGEFPGFVMDFGTWTADDTPHDPSDPNADTSTLTAECICTNK